MDLSSLVVSATSGLTIKAPVTGVDTDIVITLCGKDSDEYRAAYTVMVKAISANPNQSNAEFAKLDAAVFAACVVEWVNLDLDGDPLECTPENVLRLFNDNRFRWLHEQVIEFVGDRVNFMQPS